MIVRNAAYADCKELSVLSIYVWLHTYAKEGIDAKVSEFVLSEFIPQRSRISSIRHSKRYVWLRMIIS